mmetsp:Transcript_73660/g.116656  ORF Transcript_73660/g.116656 Transcript_73660/m.116656 type:complete len:111 (-) Transcript_73660:342-674(-)
MLHRSFFFFVLVFFCRLRVVSTEEAEYSYISNKDGFLAPRPYTSASRQTQDELISDDSFSKALRGARTIANISPGFAAKEAWDVAQVTPIARVTEKCPAGDTSCARSLEN